MATNRKEPKKSKKTVLGRRIILPPRDEMLERLKKVHSEEHVVENLYLGFLALASRKRSALEVVTVMQMALHDFLEAKDIACLDLDPEQMMYEHLRAIIPDEEIWEEACGIYSRALAEVRRHEAD